MIEPTTSEQDHQARSARIQAALRRDLRLRRLALAVVILVLIDILVVEYLLAVAFMSAVAAIKTSLGAGPAEFLHVSIPAVVWIVSLRFLNFGSPIVPPEPEPWWKVGFRVLFAPTMAAIVLFGDLCGWLARALERLKRKYPGLPRWLV